MLLLLQQVAFADRFVLDKCIDLNEVIEYQEMPDTSLYVLGKSKHYATHAWDYTFDANGNVLDSTWIAVQPNTFLEYEVYHLNKYDKNDNLIWSYTLDTQYAYKDFYGFDESHFPSLSTKLASFHIYDNKIYTAINILPHYKPGIGSIKEFVDDYRIHSTVLDVDGGPINKETILKGYVCEIDFYDYDIYYNLTMSFIHNNPQPIVNFYYSSAYKSDPYPQEYWNRFSYDSDDSISQIQVSYSGFSQMQNFYLSETINNKVLNEYKQMYVIIKDNTDTIPLTYLGNTLPLIHIDYSGFIMSYLDTNYFLLLTYTESDKVLYMGNWHNGILQKMDGDNTIFSGTAYCDFTDYTTLLYQILSFNNNIDIFRKYIVQSANDKWVLSKFNGQQFVLLDTLDFKPKNVYVIGEYIFISYDSPLSFDSVCIFHNDTIIYKGLLEYIDQYGYERQLVTSHEFGYLNSFYTSQSYQVFDNHIFSNYYSNAYYSLIDDTYSLLNEGIDKYYIGEYLPLRKKFLLWNNPNFKTNIASCNAGFFHITDKEAIVRVRAYYDYNKNGIIDAGEKPLSSYKLQYPINGDDFTTYINDTNYYTVRIDTGLHHFTVSVSDTLFTVLVPTQSVYSQNYGSVDTLIYLIQPIKTVNDVAIKINRNGTSRPGFDNSYTIQLENKGTTQVYISKLKLLYNPTLQLQPYINEYPFTKNGDSIIINFNQYLLPQEKYYLQFYFKVATSPIANIGDTIINSISIGSGYSDDNDSNNYALLQDIIVGAYDPNDKQVDMPNYAIDDPMQVASQSLNYTIRFENKGNYYATHVFVHDTLPPGLNASTLQVIATSHPYTLSVINDSILEFQFWDIYLDYADASNKGFITYSVATQSDIALLQEPIRNKASIVFDYNLPIVTEYAVTTIQIPTPNPTDKTSKATLRLYPNPNNGYFHIDLQNLEVITHAYIIDSKGSTIPVTLQGNTIEVQQLPTGMYQLVLQSIDTTWNVSFVKQ